MQWAAKPDGLLSRPAKFFFASVTRVTQGNFICAPIITIK
jgi:hypothetical protein